VSKKNYSHPFIYDTLIARTDNRKMFAELLGKRIKQVLGRYSVGTDDEICFNENVTLLLDLTSLSFKWKFHENVDGEVFYDLNISFGEQGPYDSAYLIDSPPILRIEVFGRKIFRDSTENALKEDNDIGFTEDAFVFKGKNFQALLAFHSFHPSCVFLFGENFIKDFFLNNRFPYTFRYAIE
jgi:hypothetical protein